MERQFSERQLIRWAIPGWITLFLVTLLLSVHLGLDAEFRNIVCNYLKELPSGTIAAGGAAVIAFGFALGFTLFQIYFVLYWCTGEFCENLVGGVVNYEQVVHALDNFKSMLERDFGHWPARLRDCRTRRHQMGVSVVAAWWHAMNQNKERMVWEERNNYLVSVYHALGAILIGTYLIWLCYLATIVTGLVHSEWAALWLPLLINLALQVAWYFALRFGRQNTEISHRNLMKHALHYFYQEDAKEEQKPK